MRVPIFCLDLSRSLYLIYSAAWADALQEQTALVYRNTPDTLLGKLDYAFQFWFKGPDEIQTTDLDQQKLRETTARLFASMTQTFLERAARGPQDVSSYLAGLQRVRDLSLQKALSVSETASAMNRQVADRAKAVGVTIAAIKCVDTLAAVAIGGAITFGVGGGGVVAIEQASEIKVVGDVVLEFVKDWNHGTASGKAVGIALKYRGEKWIDQTVESKMKGYEAWAKNHETAIKQAEERVAQLSAAVKAKALDYKKGDLHKARAWLQKLQAKAPVAAENAKLLKRTQLVKKGIPIVSMTMDAFEAFHDLYENLGELGVIPKARGAAE
jgi:hypothetical protein